MSVVVVFVTCASCASYGVCKSLFAVLFLSEKGFRVSNSFGHLNMDSTIFYCEVKKYISQALTLPALSVRYNNKNSLIALINVMKQLVHALIITITKLLNLIGYQLP